MFQSIHHERFIRPFSRKLRQKLIDKRMKKRNPSALSLYPNPLTDYEGFIMEIELLESDAFDSKDNHVLVPCCWLWNKYIPYEIISKEELVPKHRSYDRLNLVHQGEVSPLWCTKAA